MSRDSSLIDVLAIALVAGVIVVIGLRAVQRPRGGVPPTNACIANLKQIQGAIEMWTLENHFLQATNHPVLITDISGSPTKFIKQLINKELICPAGGKYSLTTVGEAPRCSIAGHTL